MFFDNGWQEFAIAVGLIGKDPTVLVHEDEFADVLNGLAMPLTRHLIDLEKQIHLLTEDEDGKPVPNEELKNEL